MTTTLYDSVNTLLKRLDDYPTDNSEQIWTRAELELYLQDGYDAFCRQTKCLIDFVYPENIPLAGNYVAKWELGYFDSGMIALGLVNFSGGYWERDYAEAGAIGPANLTQPWEDDYLTTTYYHYFTTICNYHLANHRTHYFHRGTNLRRNTEFQCGFRTVQLRFMVHLCAALLSHDL